MSAPAFRLSYFQSDRARSGFTLVELMTVIAIILILASLLLPAVGRMRVKAKGAESLSNLRQIAAAVILFAGDHDGYFPHGDQYHYQLRPYLTDALDNRTIYKSGNADAEPVVTSINNIPITYSMHGFLTSLNSEGNGLGQRLTMMSRPSRTILIADGIQNPDNFNQANWRFEHPSAYVYGNRDQFTEAQLAEPLEDNTGPRGIGPDRAGPNAGWFRYCNDGAVACAFGDGRAGLILKGEVTAGHLVP